MLNWFKKLFVKAPAKTQLPEELPDEKGLNEEMISGGVDLEPKENNGFAKIFENTEKEEKEEASEGGAEEENEESK